MNEGLTVVIPAYNEEESIKKTVEGVRESLPNSPIIVVDDCSKDKTLKILKSIATKDKKMKIISHEKNKGHGCALKTGFKNVKTEYLAFLDADLSYSPKYLPKMLEKLKENKLDIIWGNRFGGKINRMPSLRRIGNKTLNVLFLLATGKFIRDCTSGERIIRVDALKKLDVYSSTDALDFVCVLSKRTVARHLKYKTMPINYFSRGGNSKLNVVKDFIRMAKVVIMEK